MDKEQLRLSEQTLVIVGKIDRHYYTLLKLKEFNT